MLFKCIRSGNTINIEQQDDIDRMKTHEGYVSVEIKHEEEIPQAHEDAHEVPDEKEVLKEVLVAREVKQRGRPKKAK